MKILVTGRNGQVGWELARTLAPLGEVIALDRSELDLSVRDQIESAVDRIKPDVIVNAAAYTAVDRAESEPDLAEAVNATAPGILANASSRIGALLVHYSTDYVFDGRKTAPYVESDAPNPLSVYGRTKLEGEQAIQASGCRHLILRTSWVYASRGKNFLLTIQKLARERPELRVVSDQFGAPTSAAAIGRATASMLARNREGYPITGIFHLSAGGVATWYDFAKLIVARAGVPSAKVHSITTSEYPTAAQRPRNSCLDNSKLAREHGIALEPWNIEVEAVLRDQVLHSETPTPEKSDRHVK